MTLTGVLHGCPGAARVARQTSRLPTVPARLLQKWISVSPRLMNGEYSDELELRLVSHTGALHGPPM